MKARHQEAWTAYAFLAAPMAVLALSTFGPILFSFILAFFDWHLLKGGPEFVGLRNFLDLGRDEVFDIALKNTMVYAMGVVPAQTALALLLAMAVNRAIPGRAFFRAAFYVPAITSSVVTSVIFLWIYAKTGLLNYLLSQIGFAGEDWLGSPRFALFSIMALNIWSTSGYFMIAFLAGLQAIPKSLYEAATMDHAGRMARFWHITLPSLRPTIFLVLTMGLIGAFHVFDQIYIMSNGGPANATTTMSFFIYASAFHHFRFGYASAASIILFLVILALTLVQKRLLEERTGA